MNELCVFCDSPDLSSRDDGGRRYLFCPVCGGISLDPRCMLSPDDEYARYRLHRNSASDPGYRAYLGRFADLVLAFPAVAESEAAAGIRTIFDYGSGPEPVLVDILCDRGFDARGYDPFFQPDAQPFPGGSDLVTCLEVAEHFARPRADFRKLADCVRRGGFCAVGTHLVPEGDAGSVQDRFLPWWYRQDTTHVSFYTERSLRLVAGKAGLDWLGSAGPHAFLFRKL